MHLRQDARVGIATGGKTLFESGQSPDEQGLGEQGLDERGLDERDKRAMSKIGFVTIGAVDGAKSGAFYDAVFGALGSERKLENDGWISYGAIGPGKSIMDCHTSICPPHDGRQARAGNGIMIAYQGKTPGEIQAAYSGGIRNGGTDEGEPGFRPPEEEKGFYAAYLRDPTGNKLCLFCLA
jgi:catechol 2,3-dioxygenase-like lactoylglutathione lyase family enzyme